MNLFKKQNKKMLIVTMAIVAMVMGGSSAYANPADVLLGTPDGSNVTTHGATASGKQSVFHEVTTPSGHVFYLDPAKIGF